MKRTHILSAMLGAALSAAGLAAPAVAQISSSDAPIEVTADRMEALRPQGQAIYTRNVTAIQGTTRINSDKLTIVCARPEAGREVYNDECREIVQMIAEGNVYYTTPQERIRGDRAEYDYRTDTITVTGDVIMSRGAEGVIRGTRLAYHITEGRATITAGQQPVQSIFTPAPRDSAPPAQP
jgi:lipopolysaccharide export system protein LptA